MSHAETPRNCMRQHLEGRVQGTNTGRLTAPNLSHATVDEDTAEVVLDKPAPTTSKSYKPVHGGYPGSIK